MTFQEIERRMEKENKGINRRVALKRMGIITAGAAVATFGIPTLTSCGDTKKKSRIILYFTATGNCLHVARELTDTDEQLLSIPQMIKQERYEFEADEIGIVYPIYGHMPPNMVRKFIRKARLKAEYTFAVLTYGNRKCNAVGIWDKLTSELGKPFDYIATIIMVDNWLPNFDMNEQIKIDKHIPENLTRISADLSKRKKWKEPFTEEESRQHEEFMVRARLDPDTGFLLKSEKCFTITDNCIGCGICTDVCPRGNYGFTSQGIVTEGDCELCFACIHNCPQKVIQFARTSEYPLLARGEKNPHARYRNEHISLVDIKRANRQ